MLVRQIADSKLAQFAYLIGCPRTGEAIVIDPERDVDRYFDLAARHTLRIVAAVDTHIHADYLSGLREMAARGVFVYASKEGGPDWQYEWLIHGEYPHRLLGHRDQYSVGYIEFVAVHTPGHTPEHLSYLVRDAGGGAQDFIALASGDFVFRRRRPAGPAGTRRRHGGRDGALGAGAVCVHPARVPGVAGVPSGLARTRRG